MKRFALAVALACLLSGPVLAGDSHTTGAPAPGEIPMVLGQIPLVPREVPSVGLQVWLTILDLAF
jgi:hypothetical protein